jgi:hypothetical protein
LFLRHSQRGVVSHKISLYSLGVRRKLLRIAFCNSVALKTLPPPFYIASMWNSHFIVRGKGKNSLIVQLVAKNEAA